MRHRHRPWVLVNALIWATRAFAYALLNPADPSIAGLNISSTIPANAPSDPFITHEDYYEIRFSHFHSPASIPGPVILFVNAAARSLADEMRRQHATNISFVPDGFWQYIDVNQQRFRLAVSGDRMLIPMIYAEVWTIMMAIRSYISAWGPDELVPSAIIDFFDDGFEDKHHAAEGLLEFGPLGALLQPMGTNETS